jgi:hypothetical protein
VKDVENIPEPDFHIPHMPETKFFEDQTAIGGVESATTRIRSRALSEQVSRLHNDLQARILSARELKEAVYFTTHELVAAFGRLGDKAAMFEGNIRSLGEAARLYENRKETLVDTEKRLLETLIEDMQLCEKLEKEHTYMTDEIASLEAILSESSNGSDPLPILQENVSELESRVLPQLREETSTLMDLFERYCREADDYTEKIPGLQSQVIEQERLLDHQKRLEDYLHARLLDSRKMFLSSYTQLLNEERRVVCGGDGEQLKDVPRSIAELKE